MLIDRPLYLDRLIAWKDKHLVKIITGVRRSGKSTLFKIYQNYLLSSGVQPEQIINLNMEDPEYTELLDWQKLYRKINSRLLPDKKNYIFLDEIQNVKDFQRAADGLFIKENVDLYLTGSNSKFQSGEWATLLAGRYLELHILPLSFKEYISVTGRENLPQKFTAYLENSSFPQSLEFTEKQDIKNYLQGIYNTIVLKDVMENKQIKNAGRLERVIKFMADNIGNISSIKKITDTLTAAGTEKIYAPLVENYLDAFCDSYILYKLNRYDIKGKNLLKTLDKYYLVDLGLRYFLLGNQPADRGRLLENIVYLELRRRGYKTYVGKVNIFVPETGKVKTTEVDFVAEGVNETQYYQVADSVTDKKTLQRELRSLEAIPDHNPKILLTMDFWPPTSHNGIKQVNILDWLLD
ncbi:MAG: ATP-binding protein [Candidatus Margulisbacteria bacterium]|jgi:predicted AAA+ superfamily ATPase|nr:ATP-binding protein [Candidatus Margulisiibacteriota bacterium]